MVKLILDKISRNIMKHPGPKVTSENWKNDKNDILVIKQHSTTISRSPAPGCCFLLSLLNPMLPPGRQHERLRKPPGCSGAPWAKWAPNTRNTKKNLEFHHLMLDHLFIPYSLQLSLHLPMNEGKVCLFTIWCDLKSTGLGLVKHLP